MPGHPLGLTRGYAVALPRLGMLKLLLLLMPIDLFYSPSPFLSILETKTQMQPHIM